MADLDERIAALSPQKRALLERYLIQQAAPGAGEEPIRNRPERNGCPLSLAQQRLWFVEQLHPGHSAYNVPVAIRLSGSLSLAVLQQSLDEIVRRHEALRTTFPVRGGQPVQRIAPAHSVDLTWIDLQPIPEGERESEAARRISAAAERPFDLERGPLLRATLLQLGAEEQILLLVMHHMVSDGWSVGVLFRELGALYGAFATGQPSPLPELPVQYADFSLWEREWLQGERLQGQIDYWKQQLGGDLPSLAMPGDRPRPAAPTFRGACRSLSLPPSLTAALKDLSRREGVTLFMTLLAAFQALLMRYTGQEELLVGSPIAHRDRVEIEGLIGFFVNTLVFRADLSGNPTFRALLQRVREVALGAFAHPDLPFEKLVEELHPTRDLSRQPLFQVVFALQNAPQPPLELLGLTLRRLEVERTTTPFDLALYLTEVDDGLLARVEYSTDLFDASTITRLLDHYRCLLEGIAAGPDQSIAELPLLTAAERRQLLVECNHTQVGYPRDRCVHQLFEAQVERTPTTVAVECGEVRLTYEELNARANQWAHHLRKLGVGPDVPVGICVERSLEMLIGLLAILKAGGAYLPLEPSFPRERLGRMMAEVPVVLTQRRLRPLLPATATRVVCLDPESEVSRESSGNPESGVTLEHLAYVLHTSGSTGLSKGVCVPHRSVVRLVKGADYAALTAAERFLQLAPLSFDASTFEIWGALLNGACLVIFPPHTPTLGELGETIQRCRITTLWLTAGLFHQMVEDRPEALRNVGQLLAGGEALSAPHVRKAMTLLNGGRVINGYGPTEGTTFTCCCRITALGPEDHSVPIGRPIANTEVYVLDRHLQPVPVGVPGELYIGGDGLARGYLHQPELTAERFIPHLFSDTPGARLYRSGDLVRFRPDGNLEFLGRLDDQVKIRGFRIEPGEIEATLAQHPAVRESVVLARADQPGEKQLVAYVVPYRTAGAAPDELRRFLQEKLPAYLIPAAIILLAAMPLTPQGKVDRRALPAPDRSSFVPGESLAAPRDPLEKQLAAIWENVLRVRPIGVRDNFFDLGGHSLLAVRLMTQLERSLGRALPLRALFHAPTVEQLAHLIRQEGRSPGPSSLIAIQPGGSRPPFFCVSSLGGSTDYYRDLAGHLGPDQPLYALHPVDPQRLIESQTGRFSLETRIVDTATHYVQEIQSLQPEGPYYLGGHCLGGTVAFEVAQQLHAQGSRVGLLALLEPSTLPFALPNRTAQKARYHLRALLQLGPKAKLQHAGQLLRGLKGRAGGGVYETVPDLGAHLPGPLRHQWRVRLEEERDRLSGRSYAPQVYPGRIAIFWSTERPRELSRAGIEAWSQMAAGGVELYEVPGDHMTMIREPQLQVLAEKLQACLENAQPERSRA